MPLPPLASCLRDRTSEFAVIVERLQKAQSVNNDVPGGAAPTPSTSAPHQEHANSEFSRKAAEIGHGVHRTSLKLQRLAQIAKRTNTFDDASIEIDELTGIIKQDIQALNSSIADLQRLSNRAKEGNKQSESHSHTVVDNLRGRLKDATQEFKDVLTARTETLKHHNERRQLFSSNTSEAETAQLLHRRVHANGPSMQAANAMADSHKAAAGLPMSSSHASHAPPPSFLQQQQQQLQLAEPQDAYLSSRAEALHNVESTIVELGSIFNKLSEMVAEQGELAIRIDENVDDTLSNVTSAQAQLLKYFNSLSSNRFLLMKVLGVLMIFLVFFIMFIV